MTEQNMEFEEESSFRFDTWLKLYPGTPSIGEIEEWWLERLRRVVSKSETRAYEKGAAEERRRIEGAVLEWAVNENLNHKDGDTDISGLLSLIHDTK